MTTNIEALITGLAGAVGCLEALKKYVDTTEYLVNHAIESCKDAMTMLRWQKQKIEFIMSELRYTEEMLYRDR